MKKYILIAGVNGVGKSTLFYLLHELTGMPRVNTDEIVREFGKWDNPIDVMKAGKIARKTKSVSETGARLDTVADIVFVAVCFVKILPLIQFPTWLWIWIVVIATIKIGNVVWGLIYNKKLVSMHSILNKATGFLLFIFPLTLSFIEPMYSSVIVCSLATVSAINEVYYTRMGREIS